MKKITAILSIILTLTLLVITPAYAESDTKILEEKEQEVSEVESATELSKFQEKTNGKIEQYSEKYGSKVYGVIGLILDVVRIYSIPFCILGIAVGAIYQYIIGIRRLDIRDRGFNLIIAFVTVLVIAQVLPLVFTIAVRGWVF